MKRVLLTTSALLLTLCSARGVAAQGRVALEINGGAAIPTQTFGAGDGADTGSGFAASAIYTFVPGVAGYAGYSRSNFSCDNSFCGRGGYRGAGVNAGAELSLQRGRVAQVVYPWVRGGVAIHTLSHDVREEVGMMRVTSDRAVGYEVGAGIALPLANRVTFRPGVGYTSFRAEFDQGQPGNTNPQSMNVRVLAAGLSVRVRL